MHGAGAGPGQSGKAPRQGASGGGCVALEKEVVEAQTTGLRVPAPLPISHVGLSTSLSLGAVGEKKKRPP